MCVFLLKSLTTVVLMSHSPNLSCVDVSNAGARTADLQRSAQVHKGATTARGVCIRRDGYQRADRGAEARLRDHRVYARSYDRHVDCKQRESDEL